MRTQLHTFWPVLLFVGALLAFWAGAATWAARSKRDEIRRLKAPSKWPLSPRAIINSEERRMWRWLELAFVDYSVMVKIPVTRFSMPNSRQEGIYWFQLLSSLYCSFTVVRADGQVMGCVDLPSHSGEKNKSQRMKASFLVQCGISYVVMQKGVQPTLMLMRIKFLVEASAMPQSTQQAAAINASSSQLRNSILRTRQTRPQPLSLEVHTTRTNARHRILNFQAFHPVVFLPLGRKTHSSCRSTVGLRH